MADRSVRRRQILTGLGTLSMIAISGCVDGDSSTTPKDTETTDDDPETTHESDTYSLESESDESTLFLDGDPRRTLWNRGHVGRTVNRLTTGRCWPGHSKRRRSVSTVAHGQYI